MSTLLWRRTFMTISVSSRKLKLEEEEEEDEEDDEEAAATLEGELSVPLVVVDDDDCLTA